MLFARDHPVEGTEIADAGKDDAEDPGILHGAERFHRPLAGDELPHLLSDPLRREFAQPLPRPDRGGEPGRIELVMAVFGMEAEEAEDAQAILGDSLRRVADEADAAGDDVVMAADRIVDRCLARRPKAR